MHKPVAVLVSLMIISSYALAPSVASAQWSWSKYEANPVLTVGPDGAHDDKQAHVSCVVKVGPEYWMYYYGSPTWSTNSKYVMLATSTDGLNWTKYGTGDEPLDFGISGYHEIMGISVLYDPSSSPHFQAWYGKALSSGYSPIDIFYATSDDGINWDLHGTVLSRGSGWESFRVQWPCVRKDNGIYHMWYQGHEMYAPGGVGHATSTDGINWTKDPANPVISPEMNAPWVVLLDDTYYMFVGSASGFLCASSQDGSLWDTGGFGSPVLGPGPSGSWDGVNVERLAALVDGGQLKGWYAGGNTSVWQTGYAVSEVPLIPATIDVDPDVLNPGSRGRWITAYIELSTEAAGCDLPQYDDFNDGNDDGWTHHCPDETTCTWAVADGVYELGGPWVTVSTLNSTNDCCDYAFEADVRTDSHDGIVVFRFQDVDTCYNLNIRPYVQELTLERRPDGLFESVYFPSSPYTWYRVRVEVCGANIKCFVDGIKYIDVDDPEPYLCGPVGLWGHTGQTGRFDNVSVTPLDCGDPADGYDPSDIDVSTVMLNETVPAEMEPTELGDYDEDGIPDRMVKFSRSAVIDILPSGEQVEVRVSGQVAGAPFAGADSIRVLMPVVTYPNGGEAAPTRFALYQAEPNPFTAGTVVRFDLPESRRVKLSIHDVCGRLVRELIDEMRPAGTYSVQWDGKDALDRLAPSGIYFAHLEAGTMRATGKIVIVR